MKFRKNIYLILLVGITLAKSANGQKYRILQSNKNFERVRLVEKFDYLHEEFDTTKFEWVADYRVTLDTILPETIETIYSELKARSNRLGANAFRVREADVYTVNEEKHIDVSFYWLRMERRDENMKMFYSKDAYLFGFLAYHIVLEGYKIEYEDEEFLLNELTYMRFKNDDKKHVQLKAGGIARGSSESFRPSSKTLPKYFFFEKTTGSFKNSWISEYDWSFGEFLIRILDKA